MTAATLSELLPEFGKPTPVIAGRWVAAALAHAAALREYDQWLYTSDPARVPAAEHLHDAWRLWAQEAQAVLGEADALAAVGHEIPDIGMLRDILDRTRAFLKMAPAVIMERYAQAHRGEVYSVEEARRELRIGSRG